jgi:NAD(P)-dependent dehydrogenase (short-subunit alcohol dehydrogenase family)
MAEVARAADQIAAITDRIDLLANNAGGMASSKVVTPEGLEANFAGNHLGPFLLTELLMPLLKRTAAKLPAGSVRIVNTSSDGSEMIAGLDWDDLQQLGGEWNAGKSYCQSKLANVLHARGLARQLAADGIVAHSFHPGTVASNFVAHVPDEARAHINTLKHISSDEGADTLLWLATSDEAGATSGGYYYERKPREPHPLVNDDRTVERLFEESRELIAGASQNSGIKD